MSHNKEPNWKWLTQHVIVPIIVAFIAGGAGTAVIVTIWNAQPAIPTPQPTPTSVVLVSENNTLTPTPTSTLVSPPPTFTEEPQTYTPTSLPPLPTSTSTIVENTPQPMDRFPNGTIVTPEELSNNIGGEAAYWARSSPGVWQYLNQGHNALFRHPGGNAMLTYWWGFPEPENVPIDCIIEKIDYNGPTRTIRCSTAGATFSADGVGLHLGMALPPAQSYAEKLCPFAVKQGDINRWMLGVQEAETVRLKIKEFDDGRPNNGGQFEVGAKIPAGVIVATNFDANNPNSWTNYPVIAIVHSGGYGLFQTTEEYVAPNQGACRIIIP